MEPRVPLRLKILLTGSNDAWLATLLLSNQAIGCLVSRRPTSNLQGKAERKVYAERRLGEREARNETPVTWPSRRPIPVHFKKCFLGKQLGLRLPLKTERPALWNYHGKLNHSSPNSGGVGSTSYGPAALFGDKLALWTQNLVVAFYPPTWLYCPTLLTF